VPKQETDYIFDLDDDTVAGIMIFSKKVASALKAAIPCVRIGIAILGLEVPHAHIHLVPMNSMEDVNFRNPKLKFTPEQFTATAEKIKNEL
jgi:histidine triad (HIT) family protein